MEILWDRPSALLLLWLLVPIAALFAWSSQRRRRAARAFLDSAMIPRLMPQPSRSREWTRAALFALAFASLVVGLARPRWGVFFEQVSQRGADVMIAIDVSKSMLVEDVAPNRLERAKNDVLDFLKKVRGDRVGLVAFAGKASLKCPLTIDHGFFKSVLADLGSDSAPLGGTAIGDAIRVSLGALPLDQSRDQALLLVTDGEDHDSYPLEAAQLAAERKVKIITIGLGDSGEGARIPVRNATGALIYVQHQGQEVWSKMDERLLREIALATHGAYVPARTSIYDLGEVYVEHLATLKAGEIHAEKRKRYRERFQSFVVLSLVLFLCEILMRPYPRRAMAGAAALSFLALPSPLPAIGDDAQRLNSEAIRLVTAGDFDTAADRLEAASIAQPENPTLSFNRARVRQYQGKKEESRDLYQKAALEKDVGLSADSWYNLGTLECAAARQVLEPVPEQAAQENRTKALDHLRAAIQDFRGALDIDPGHPDARHNLEVLRLYWKHLENAWAENDRQKNRDEMDLLQFLELVKSTQGALKDRTASEKEQPDSPLRRVTVKELAEAQRKLMEEVPTLRAKIEQQFAAPPATGAPGAAPPAPVSPPAPSPPDDEQERQMQEARKALLGLTDASSTAMEKAASDLDATLFDGALSNQKQAFEPLESMWLGIVPFDRGLSAALGMESDIVHTTLPFAPPEPAAEEASRTPSQETPEASAIEPMDSDSEEKSNPVSPPPPSVPFEVPTDTRSLVPLADRQRRVQAIAALLPMKGEQMLAQAEGMPHAAPPAAGPGTEDDPAHQQLEEQRQALRTAVDKAKNHAPALREHCTKAITALDALDGGAAHVEATEIQRLLEDIAQSLPKDQQPSQGDGDSQDPQSQDPPQDPQAPQSDDPKSKDDAASGSPQEQPLTREQAEALLRKAKEREQKHREHQKELQRQGSTRTSVDKDW